MSAGEIALDRDRCCGFGLCAGYAPEVFSLDAAGIAELRVAAVPADQLEAVRAAALACPQQVITLRLAPG